MILQCIMAAVQDRRINRLSKEDLTFRARDANVGSKCYVQAKDRFTLVCKAIMRPKCHEILRQRTGLELPFTRLL